MDKFKQVLNITNTIFKDDKKLILWAIVLTLATTISSNLIIPFAMQSIFEAVQAGVLNNLYKICFICVGSMIVLMFLSFIFYAYADAWFVMIANKGISVMTKDLYNLPYKKINDTFSEGELINRIGDGGISSTHIYNVGSRLSATLVSIFGLMIASFFVSKIVLVFIIIITILDIFRFKYEINKQSAILSNIKTSESKLEENVYNLISNISFHTINNTLEIATENFRKERDIYWNENKKILKLKNTLDFISGLYYTSCRAILSFILIPSATSIVTAFAIFDSYKSNILQCKEHMLRFPNFFKSIERMNEIFEKVKAPVEVKNKDKNKNNILINIQNLSFYYQDNQDNQDNLVLNNINLEINHNEKIALIGDNGTGKSTLLRLILGLYTPTSGSVYINNINSESLKSNTRQDLFAYIPIEPQLFSESISRNIQMGCFNSIKNLQDDDLNNILSSCGLSNIDISSISTTLSGGESTRVNMARAMASSHKIIIADELLASLDCCVIMTVH
ncbi:MAG: ABC transporter ATP-binding protein, partial [bacterium]